MPALPPLSPSHLARLKETTHLLHLIIHRNKNQHRMSRWWKWVGLLRREMRKLATEAERGGDIAVRRRVEERMEFLRTEVVGRAYWAFTTVVADRRYASLGIVLVGVLASVGRIVGFKAEGLGMEESGDEKVEVVDGEEDAGVRVERGGGEGEGGGREDERMELGGGEDVSEDQRGEAVLGEVADGVGEEGRRTNEMLGRVEDGKQRKKHNEKEHVGGGEMETKTKEEEKRKRKRKKGAAADIDDLFSGLV